jgi:hypothetical protein
MAERMLRFYGGPWAGKIVNHRFPWDAPEPPNVLLVHKNPYVLFREYRGGLELCYRYCETEDEKLDTYALAIELTTG